MSAEERKPNSNIPDSFQTPNHFVDSLMHLLTPPEWMVLSFMARHIYGWEEGRLTHEKTLSINMFMNGYTSGNGRRFNGTGLGRNAILSALDALVKYGVIETVGNPGPDGQRWRIPPDDSATKYDNLEKRKDAAYQANAKRSATAREKLKEKKGKPEPAGLSDKLVETSIDPPVQFVPQTDSGLSDKPEPSLSDKPEVVCGTNTTKSTGKPTEETNKETHVPRIASASAAHVPPREPAIDTLMDTIHADPEAPPVATALPEKTEDPLPPIPVAPSPVPELSSPSVGDTFYITADGARYGPYNNYNAVKDAVKENGFKQVSVTQIRPEGDVILPDKPGRKPGRKPKADGPRLEQPPADVKDRFALLCYNGTEITGASWARLIKAWNRLEKPPAEKFDRFSRWWKACDWRGAKGQRPTPEQVVSEWDVAQNWDGATPVAATPYQQNYRSKAELDAERNRINVQKGIEKARQFQAEREANGGAPKDVSNLLAWKAELEAKRGKS